MCSTALSESSDEYSPQEMTSPRGWICTSEYYATQLIALTTPNMKILIGWKVTRWLASRHHAQNYATTPFTPHVHVLQESFTFSIKRLHHSEKASAMYFFSDDQISLLKCQSIPSFRTLAPIEHIYSLDFPDLIVVVVGTSNWEIVQEFENQVNMTLPG